MLAHSLRILIVVVALVAVSLIPLATLLEGVPLSHDLPDHLAMASQVRAGWADGLLYPRWHAELNFGWGEPTGVFYPPLLHFVVAGLDAATGLGLLVSLGLALALFSLIGTAGVFQLGKTLGGAGAGWLAALLYVFLPFRAFELHASGLFSQFAASCFLPWLLLVLVRLDRQGREARLREAVLRLAPVYGLIVLTNLPLGVLSTFLVGTWAAVACLRQRSARPGLNVLAGGVTGAALAAVFLLPAIAELPHLHIPHSGGEPLHRSNFVFQTSGSWMSEGLASLFDRMGVAMALPVALAALMLGLLRILRVKQRIRALEGASLAPWLFAACALFLATPLSLPVWDHLPVLHQVNMPWRLLTVLAAPASALAGVTVIEILRSQRMRSTSPASAVPPRFRTALIGLPLLAGASLFGGLLSHSIEWMNERGHRDQEAALVKHFTRRQAFFLPRDAVDPTRLRGYPPLRLVGTPGSVRILTEGPEIREYEVELDRPGSLVARTYRFPGWRARLVTGEGAEEVATTTHAESGGIALELPAGKHRLRLSFESTLARLAGGSISMLTLAGLIGLALGAWRDTRARRKGSTGETTGEAIEESGSADPVEVTSELETA